MRKALGQIVPCFFLVILFFIPSFFLTSAQTWSPFYFEDFNGSSIDLTQWSVIQNVNGGFGGTAILSGDCLDISSYGTSYPLVTNRMNPFPETGNFRVEFDAQFTKLDEGGTGFWVSEGEFIPNWPESDAPANILEVWGGKLSGITATLMETPVFQSFSNVTENFTVILSYSVDTYTLYINGLEIASAQSTLRANSIGFGHPPVPYIPTIEPGGWTSFRVDTVSVSQELAPTPSGNETPSTDHTQPSTLIITLAGIVLACTIVVSLILLLIRSVKRNTKTPETKLSLKP
jgi:hypothetical protein